MKLLTFLNFIIQTLWKILENQQMFAHMCYKIGTEKDESEKLEYMADCGFAISDTTEKFLKKYKKIMDKEARL